MKVASALEGLRDARLNVLSPISVITQVVIPLLVDKLIGYAT